MPTFVKNVRFLYKYLEFVTMIREFWVENYYSIKERQTLNFETKGSPDAFSSVDVTDKVRINKIAILYGANASGKSNILFALQLIFRLLITPRSERSEKVIGYMPFALLKGEPTNMGISFFVDAIRYDYEVSFNNDYILSETLNYYPNGSKSLFYKRDFLSENTAASISFGQSISIGKKTESIYISNTLNNHTVLSTFAKTSFEESILLISNLYNWITKHVHDVNGDREDGVVSFADTFKDICSNAKMKSFYLQMIKKADFNITDFHYEERTRTLSDNQKKLIQQNTDFPESFKKFLLEGKTKDVLFTSKAGDKVFELDSSAQSSGTLSFIQRLRFLFDTITEKHIYFLDEPEEDLHYDLFLFYLNAFLFNSSGSQIIMASHITSLLAEDLINENRDLVFFVEKDSETATSKFIRGDKFGLHKNQSLFNAYKIGRLGAKPELGSPFILAD